VQVTGSLTPHPSASPHLCAISRSCRVQRAVQHRLRPLRCMQAWSHGRVPQCESGASWCGVRLRRHGRVDRRAGRVRDGTHSLAAPLGPCRHDLPDLSRANAADSLVACGLLVPSAPNPSAFDSISVVRTRACLHTHAALARTRVRGFRAIPIRRCGMAGAVRGLQPAEVSRQGACDGEDRRPYAALRHLPHRVPRCRPGQRPPPSPSALPTCTRALLKRRHANTRTRTHTRARAHTHTHTHTESQSHIYTHSHTLTVPRARVRTCTPTVTHTCARVRTSAHTPQ